MGRHGPRAYTEGPRKLAAARGPWDQLMHGFCPPTPMPGQTSIASASVLGGRGPTFWELAVPSETSFLGTASRPRLPGTGGPS